MYADVPYASQKTAPSPASLAATRWWPRGRRARCACVLANVSTRLYNGSALPASLSAAAIPV
jgi:hypothetical protein